MKEDTHTEQGAGRWRPRALKALFRSRGFRTRGSLGQHLLLEPAVLARVVAAGGPIAPSETILEIGTGPGMLTRLLLGTGARVVGVECDPRALSLLDELIGAHPRLERVFGDVLEGREGLHPEALSRLEGKTVRCISNFPYHVATPLIVRLLELGVVERRFELKTIAGTLQREVAERLAAPPGDRRRGAASVLVQSLARVELCGRLKPGAFWPPPKVESAIVRMRVLEPERRVGAQTPPSWARYAGLVRALFPYRRKTVRNALRLALPKAPVERLLDEARIDGGARLEQLDRDDFARLAAIAL